MVARTIKKYLDEKDLVTKNLKNITELESALQEEWSKISKDVLTKLIESMLRRIEAVIENDGWPTKY